MSLAEAGTSYLDERRSRTQFVTILGKVAARVWNLFSGEAAQSGEVLTVSACNMHEGNLFDGKVS